MSLPSGNINDLMRLMFVEDASGNVAVRVANVGAESTPIEDAGGYFTATDVESALQEIGERLLATTPAADGTYASPTSITIENGLITAIS